MKKQIAAVLLAGLSGCAGVTSTTQGASPIADHALARPIFGSYYMCGEHRNGELSHLGDALGSDCIVQQLENIGGREFARSYRGTGERNEDWYGWHQNVFSPCDCEVVKVTENATTNLPGTLGQPPATFVVLKRPDGVHFLIAHLDLVAVETGDSLTAGQRIGVVGNNGYGRTPHIHIGAWIGDTPLQVRFDLTDRSGRETGSGAE